jgi:hypothetical protein
VLSEFAAGERRARRRDRSNRARSLAERLHAGRRDLVEHLRRVAFAVPRTFRAVAWLHHAGETNVTVHTLRSAGLTSDEVTAIKLFAHADPSRSKHAVLDRARTLSKASGLAGYLARVVARAAIEDRLDGARPEGDILAALTLLPDPRLTR